jgi:hypothetical protein
MWLEGLKEYLQTIALAAKNIRDLYGKNYMCMHPGHNIDPYLKSSMIKAKHHPMLIEKIEQTVRNKFRTNYEMQRWIFSMYDAVHNRAVFKRVRNFKKPRHFIHNLVHYFECKNAPAYCTDVKHINRTNPSLLCINDVSQTSDAVRENNKQFLQNKFPQKSRFEK